MKRSTLFATILLVIFVNSAHSQDPYAYDEGAELTCSSINGASCDQDRLRCREGIVADFEVPKFLTFRFSKGEIELEYRADKKRKMKMGDIHKDGTYFMTQGVYYENDMLVGAWQFVITKKTGKLHITGIERGYTYLFNGVCKK